MNLNIFDIFTSTVDTGAQTPPLASDNQTMVVPSLSNIILVGFHSFLAF